jgi:DNA-binding NarL/FixJ family response regulator
MRQDFLARPTRIMIVEDDPVTRRLLCHAVKTEPSLTLHGAFASVADALAWLKKETIDLLLTDLGLPDGSGLSIIEACRKTLPDADIMVITMSSDEEQVLACIEAGAAGYVLKEAGHIDIVRALLDLRAGGSPISPVIARKVLARMVKFHTQETYAYEENTGQLLTPRENAILELIAKGGSYAKVAEALGLSVGTVQTHVKHIYGKLSVHSRGEAVYEAHRRGLIRINEAKLSNEIT